MKRLILCLALLLGASLAFGNDVVVLNGGHESAQRAVSAADSVAPINSSDYAMRPVALTQHKTIAVSAHLQNSGATCKVAVALGTMLDGTFVPEMWAETGTMTASSTFKMPDGYYATPLVELPTASYSHFKVYVTVLSAGNANVFWSHY